MSQRVLWSVPIAFALACVDLTPPWGKTQQAIDAACPVWDPWCDSVTPTGGNGGAGGSALDRSSTFGPARDADPKDVPVGGSEASPDASVVAGQTAAAGTAGSCCGGSGGNQDAGAVGTIDAGGFVVGGGSTGGAGSGGAPDAAMAGAIGTGGHVRDGGMGGSSGGSTGEAGSGGSASTGGAGSGGSASTGCQSLADCAPARICSSGKCVAPQGLVVLTVPLTASGQDQRYAYLFNPSANLTNTTVTLRMYAPEASAGSLIIYLSMANSASTAGSGARVPLRDLRSAWKDIVFNAGGAAGSFDPSQIKQITLEVQSSDSGPWRNPTVIYMDQIVVSTLKLGNTFDSSIGGFVQSSAQAIPGSTLGWSSALP